MVWCGALRFANAPYIASEKAEVAIDCAKHPNVKAEVTSGKAVVQSHLF